jgi:hypothetical protein
LRYVGQAVIGQLAALQEAEAGRVEVWFEKYLLGDLLAHESGLKCYLSTRSFNEGELASRFCDQLISHNRRYDDQ